MCLFSLHVLIFFLSANKLEKLNNWNIALIVIGSILFVLGLVITVAYAVLLGYEIKAASK